MDRSPLFGLALAARHAEVGSGENCSGVDFFYRTVNKICQIFRNQLICMIFLTLARHLLILSTDPNFVARNQPTLGVNV
jgi:hypothetical protein